MSVSPTARLPKITNPDTFSELEDLILRIRCHNLSVVEFFLNISDTDFHMMSTRHIHKALQCLQQCEKDLKTHYGWVLASDHEQIARMGKIRDRQIGFGQLRSELHGHLMDLEENKSVKEILEDFERLACELRQAVRRFGEVGFDENK